MANPEHLDILKQGVEAWNAWREQHKGITPDLIGAGLSGAGLSGANLSGARLHVTDLSRTDLSHANFSDTTLISTNFSGADLSHTYFGYAELYLADLTYTNLTHANLNDAHLRGADLTGADMSEVLLDDTDFIRTNLTAVQGLETCRHFGPSTLDHRTIASSWPLPLAFLRGCGLPERLIEYLPSILGEAIQFYSCFISYSSEDEDFCRRLHGRMQDAGLRVWFAPHDIHGGRKLHEQIDDAIHVYDKLLLVLSPHSMRSPWVEFEIRRARKREVAEQRRLLFPVRLVDYEAIKRWECFDADTAKDLATEIGEYYIPDFTAWKDHDAFEEAFARLLRDLTAEGRPSETSA